MKYGIIGAGSTGKAAAAWLHQAGCPALVWDRDPRKRAMPETCNPAPKTKSLRQNSRPARTIQIKSRPAACTSGGINNFPLK